MTDVLNCVNQPDLSLVDQFGEQEVVPLLRKIHSAKMIEAIKHASFECLVNEKTTTPFDKEPSASYSPIDNETYSSVLSSAKSAMEAAEAVRNGVNFSFSVARPPGHHAGREFYHGFCYVNNAALAAEILKDDVNKVAIIDIDVHHGDGT